jgi:hypothetical protein
MLAHVEAHQKQHSEKLLRQALTNQLIQTFAANASSGQGLQAGGQPMDLQRLQQTLASLTGAGATAMGKPPAQSAEPALPAME